jgi:hypothetical protein
LTLQVKDRLPLHWHFDLDDKATPGTPLLRMDNADPIQQSLATRTSGGLGIRLLADGHEKRRLLPNFYDQPAVASYSAFYRAPLGERREFARNLR